MKYERIELYTDELIDILWSNKRKINHKDDKGEILRTVKMFVADNMEFDFSNQSEYSIKLKVGDMIKIPMYTDKLSYTDLYAYVAGVDCEPNIKEPHYTFIADFGECQMNTKPTIQGYYGAKTMRLFLDEKKISY